MVAGVLMLSLVINRAEGEVLDFGGGVVSGVVRRRRRAGDAAGAGYTFFVHNYLVSALMAGGVKA
jgi:hypothetical protein